MNDSLARGENTYHAGYKIRRHPTTGAYVVGSPLDNDDEWSQTTTLAVAKLEAERLAKIKS